MRTVFMKTYADVFSGLKRAALIPFFVIGDPGYDAGLAIVKDAIDAGADILELGISFSDPIADGPTIQKADIRAAKAGMNMQKALRFIREIKDYRDIPIGLLIYYNLIYQYPAEKFFADAAKAGVNSVLIADMTINDADEVTHMAKQAGLDTVFMVTPNTSDSRIKEITERITGFVYTVSVLGVTGSRDRLSSTVGDLIARIKAVTNIPVCVGFGISSPDHAKTVAQAGADGVIIGSKIVSMIEKNLDNPQKAREDISGFIKQLRKALEE